MSGEQSYNFLSIILQTKFSIHLKVKIIEAILLLFFIIIIILLSFAFFENLANFY